MTYTQFPYIAYPLASKRVAGWLLAAAMAVGGALPATSQTVANGYGGVWLDDTAQGAIEISPCGSNLCGRIVWLKSPMAPDGAVLTDIYNPDAKNKRRPICGLDVIGNLKRQADGTWDQGWIYDPKVGKQYDVELTLKSANQLSVTGYLGMKFMSQTFQWKRAPADLGRCVVIMPSAAPGASSGTATARN